MRRFFAPLAAAFLMAAPALAADNYAIDTSHTKANFRVKHFGVSWFHGQFHDVSGSVTWDAKNPAASTVEFAIKADSLFTADKKRDDHLKSPDFFNTKQFPTINFKSTAVKQAGGKWQVTGDLTLHGVTKPITADFEFVGEGKDPWGGYRAGWEGKITFKRSDFGMNFMQGGIGDEINIVVSIEGTKK